MASIWITTLVIPTVELENILDMLAMGQLSRDDVDEVFMACAERYDEASVPVDVEPDELVSERFRTYS